MQALHIIFLILLIWIIIQNIDEKKLQERNIERTPVIMLWRTEKGLKGVDFLAKKMKKVWSFISSLAVLVSIPLMVFVVYKLAESASDILTMPESPPGLAPAIPGVRVPGSPIFIPFWYGIIALVTVLIVHEIMHAIISRAEGLNVKSLGIFFVTFIPLGAFAEPDEEELEKSSLKTKLRVYAAGSFGNFLLAFLAFLLLSTVIGPVMFQPDHINITYVFNGTPAEVYGIKENTALISINGVNIRSSNEFWKVARGLKPNEKVRIVTDKGMVELITAKRPEEKISWWEKLLGREETEERGYIGIGILPVLAVNPSISAILGETIPWMVVRQLNWIFLLNLFIGITNLLPIFPLDGGRMFEEITKKISPRSAKPITSLMFALVLVLVFINMSPFLRIIF
ncbi:MAG: site-2 protease family protein [Candidatus Hydrothermarchaeales archaeon]